MALTESEAYGHQASKLAGRHLECDPVANQAEIIPLRNEGGFSFEPLPDLTPGFDAAVDESYLKNIDAGKAGITRWQIAEYRMESGVRFRVAHVEPKKRRTDIALNIGTPWATEVDGLNLHLAIKVAKLGMPVRVIGPEENASIPMPMSAFNALEFFKHDDYGENGFSNGDYSVLEGFSRGAMIAFGINAYSSKFGRQILYTDATDPCVAKSIKNLTPIERLQLLGYIPKETKGAIKLVGNVLKDPARRKHYIKTIDLSAHGLAQFIRTGIPLFNGDAGLMAHHSPKDMHMHLRFFEGSLPNQKGIFKSILAGRPNIHYDERTGVHTEGGEMETLEHLACRMSGLIIQLSSGVKPEEIDFEMVHQTADAA